MTSSRRSDPWTSHAAAAHSEASGIAARQSQNVLDMVRLHPGCTSAEIAQAMHVERHIPARRLSELASKGLVRRGEARHCDVAGSKAITWLPMASEAKRPEIVPPCPQATEQGMLFPVNGSWYR